MDADPEPLEAVAAGFPVGKQRLSYLLPLLEVYSFDLVPNKTLQKPLAAPSFQTVLYRYFGVEDAVFDCIRNKVKDDALVHTLVEQEVAFSPCLLEVETLHDALSGFFKFETLQLSSHYLRELRGSKLLLQLVNTTFELEKDEL